MKKELREKLEKFALKHKLILEEKGEVGFGRPCVGFLTGDSYVYYNPISEGDYMPIKELYDARHYNIVPDDAYHKTDCMAVLVHEDNYNEGLKQLGEWIDKLEKIGVEVVGFDPKPDSLLQAMLTGITGKALKLKKQRSKNKTI